MEAITLYTLLLVILDGVIFIGINLILIGLKGIKDRQINNHKKEFKLIKDEVYNIDEFLETIIKDHNKIKRYLEMIDIKFDKLKKE